MALSVLPIFSSRIVFGLWDSETNNYIERGEEEDMYRLKHAIEQQQQKEENAAWAIGVVDRRITELVHGGYRPAAAEKAVQKILPESYAVWERKRRQQPT